MAAQVAHPVRQRTCAAGKGVGGDAEPNGFATDPVFLVCKRHTGERDLWEHG
jgi:hypothetical protein